MTSSELEVFLLKTTAVIIADRVYDDYKRDKVYAVVEWLIKQEEGIYNKEIPILVEAYREHLKSQKKWWMIWR